MRRLLPLLLAVAACDYGFEKQSHVSKLRVLAVRAEPPEVILGTGPLPAVEFTALAVGPNGEAVEIQYALCNTAGLPSADLDCPGKDGVALRATSPLSARLDPEGFQADLPAGAPSTFPVAIGFRAWSGGQSLHGFTTLTVRTSADSRPARNPVVASLEVDGRELPADGSATVHAGAKVHLLPRGDDDQVTWSFYSTAGEIDSLRATAVEPEVDWTAPGVAGPARIWIVARDGRGGVGWLVRTVQVVP
jgi:hypothetical protein